MVGGWLDQVGIRLSQLSTKLKLKLKLSLAIPVPVGAELGPVQPQLVNVFNYNSYFRKVDIPPPSITTSTLSRENRNPKLVD